MYLSSKEKEACSCYKCGSPGIVNSASIIQDCIYVNGHNSVRKSMCIDLYCENCGFTWSIGKDHLHYLDGVKPLYHNEVHEVPSSYKIVPNLYPVENLSVYKLEDNGDKIKIDAYVYGGGVVSFYDPCVEIGDRVMFTYTSTYNEDDVYFEVGKPIFEL